ncbi:MAG: metallophosphoesterase [Myxococcota bacterium]
MPRSTCSLRTIGLSLLVAAGACGPADLPRGPELIVAHPGDQVRFAVIGDYGLQGPDEAAVAKLVASWDPEFIITLGDNNYPNGRETTIDDNVGQYYHAFISPYQGRYGQGADTNRFFPALGNHDWRTRNAWPYLEYFSLPGNERYYDLRWGPVHLFALDSDWHEPDGNDAGSDQGRWLQERMSASTLPWQLVYMHHPPYSSGDHGSSEGMRWPFAQWGADAVMGGHDHHYERLELDGVAYFVNGLGGNPTRYPVGRPLPGSRVRYRDSHGAMLVEATAETLDIRFITIDGKVVDQHVLTTTEVAMATL